MWCAGSPCTELEKLPETSRGKRGSGVGPQRRYWFAQVALVRLGAKEVILPTDSASAADLDKLQAIPRLYVGYHAAWDTMPRGIPCRVGHHAACARACLSANVGGWKAEWA